MRTWKQQLLFASTLLRLAQNRCKVIDKVKLYIPGKSLIFNKDKFGSKPCPVSCSKNLSKTHVVTFWNWLTNQHRGIKPILLTGNGTGECTYGKMHWQSTSQLARLYFLSPSLSDNRTERWLYAKWGNKVTHVIYQITTLSCVIWLKRVKHSVSY